MANLIALTPCADLLPVEIGGVTLTEVLVDKLISFAPFSGRQDDVAAALGQALPNCNRRIGPVSWFGHGAWMVAGDVALNRAAAVTDQSDAWAIVQIEGAGAEDVLARLVPVDLRARTFAENHLAKTMLGHMSVTITRVGPQAFEIMVMRSMAATLVHELDVAMRGVAARLIKT